MVLLRSHDFFCLALIVVIPIVQAQEEECTSGSSYQGVSGNKEYSQISAMMWYLNFQIPSMCSGRLKEYEVQYYSLPSNRRVYVAVWELVDDDAYQMVNSSIRLLSDSGKKRRKRNQFAGSINVIISDTDLIVRKGTVIGVYFENGDIPLPIIGTRNSQKQTTYEICINDGSLQTTEITCLSSDRMGNLFIHAEAQIETITCDVSNLPSVMYSSYELIDGNSEYEARAQYTCQIGYELVSGDEFLYCDEDENWVGTNPTCEPVSCNTIETLDNGTVNGNDYTYGAVLSFSCKSGFELDGSSSVSCLANGTWNTDIPSCVSIIQDSTRSIRSASTIPSSMQFTMLSSTMLSSTMLSSTMPFETVRKNEAESSSSVGIAAGITVVMTVIISIAIVTLIVILVVLKRKKGKTLGGNLNSDENFFNTSNPVYRASIGNQNESFNNPVYEVDKIVEEEKYEDLTVYEPVNDAIKGQHKYFQLEVSSSVSIATPYEEPATAINTSIYETCDDAASSSEQWYQYSELEPVQDRTDSNVPIYWPPENDAKKIYEQLATKKYTEIPREQIQITEHLGSGQYGTVDKGIWTANEGPVDVAVKTLKGLATEEEEIKFLQEAAINGQFHHPNVVKLFGVVTVGRPTLIVMEFIPNGDLRAFLTSRRPMPGELADDSLPETLARFSYQIASGMVYLARKRFVHRDLAARNILVGSGIICKIADFGMSRDLQDEAYYTSTNNRIPVKWTAPEAIDFRKYSTQSDVWSFGSVLYEIWSVGYKPFNNYSNQECMRLVDSGFRLPSPPGCPRSVYELMIMCWNPIASSRPTFKYLQSELSKTEHIVQAAGQLKAHLGLDINSPNSLYPDLQDKYKA